VEHLEDFVDALERPRRVILMVDAGRAVDAVLDQLIPLLDPDDTIVDGGNSFYADTERRIDVVEGARMRYLGTGISGGETGARFGPSIMPGGDERAYARLEPILTRIAAQVDDGPCVTHVGRRSAGHYVKMVHNGIEYGDMQLIAEAYDILRQVLDLSAAELADIFASWNEGELDSFLIEITSKIFRRTDEESGNPLVDMVLDKAKQKGTGKWTSQNAMDLGAPIPTINSAVTGRIVSALKEERLVSSDRLPGPDPAPYDGDRQELIDATRDALYASKISAYAQGMALLRQASEEYGYGLNLGEIAALWRAGCIIRARFLNHITDAYSRNPSLTNLLLDDQFRAAVTQRLPAWRKVVQMAVARGIPTPAFSASLAYYDSYRSARLPANLIQAQRDFFGAHTYERTEREGIFHSEWE